MRYRCAVLDDYQEVVLSLADWSGLRDRLDVKVFNWSLGGNAEVVKALQDFDIVFLIRERTPFPREVIANLPKLKLIVTMGVLNAAIDIEAAKEKGVTICGTHTPGDATAELVFAHILEFARRVGAENAALKSGRPWQGPLGYDLDGKTLGILGLAKLGLRIARIGAAFGMKPIAWSQNLDPKYCAEKGVTYASKRELLTSSDFITVNLRLSDRTRGLIGAEEFSLMKPSAFLINTSRGPIVDEAALVEALREGRIAGAGLDVFDVEPLRIDHPLRSLPRAQLTPHLGYVTEENYRLSFQQIVENIRAFMDGNPIRVFS